jgi:hypothetical protein
MFWTWAKRGLTSISAVTREPGQQAGTSGGRRRPGGSTSRHRVLLDLAANRLEDRTLLSLAGASQDQILQSYG